MNQADLDVLAVASVELLTNTLANPMSAMGTKRYIVTLRLTHEKSLGLKPNDPWRVISSEKRLFQRGATERTATCERLQKPRWGLALSA
jgi:hypothetical protein